MASCAIKNLVPYLAILKSRAHLKANLRVSQLGELPEAELELELDLEMARQDRQTETVVDLNRLHNCVSILAVGFSCIASQVTLFQALHMRISD